MAQIVIPEDQDDIAALAIAILEKNRELSREFDVRVPPKFIARLRAGRKVAAILKKVAAYRAKADELSKSIKPSLKEIQGGLRDVGQLVLRQSDVETCKRWGYAFKKGKGSGA